MTTELGEVSITEMRALEACQKTTNALVMEIGSLEVRKAHLLAQITESDRKAEGVLKSLAERLQIPEGAVWEISPDGKVLMRG